MGGSAACTATSACSMLSLLSVPADQNAAQTDEGFFISANTNPMKGFQMKGLVIGPN